MFGKAVVSVIVIVLTLTDLVVCSLSLNNVKVTGGRSLPFDSSSLAMTGRNAAFSDDEEKPDDYQNWLEDVELERRADEEIEAAEIAAAAEEEYERIKYNMEREENSILDWPESKRSSAELNGDRTGRLTMETGLEEVKEQETRAELERRPTYGKMGVSSQNCDDGIHNLAMDWDPADPANDKDYTCDSPILQPAHQTFTVECVNRTKPSHICMKRKLEKATEPPVMGHHRPLWARYGKYIYLPWQRWLHNLEHGAIGLLYHKCADPEEVAKAEDMLVNCIRRHIITPYELPPDKPMALVSWGCYLYLTHFDKQIVFDFIKNHSMKGRENRVSMDGMYKQLLEKPAKLVSDLGEKHVCPESHFPEMYDRTSTTKEAKNTKSHRSTVHEQTIDSQVTGMEEKQTSKQQLNEPTQQVQKRSVGNGKLETGNSPDKEARRFQRRDADWPENRVLGTMEGNMLPELEREAAIASLERAEVMTDLERERDIAKLETEEDVARLEREADIMHLEKDLDTVKKLFREKVKPFLHE